MVGLVNGLPLLVIELKKPGVPMRAAFDENLTHYKQQIPALFWFDGLLGTLLQERIDRLMVQFKTSAPDFYNEYLPRAPWCIRRPGRPSQRRRRPQRRCRKRRGA